MSRRSNDRDLKLNLTAAREANHQVGSPSKSEKSAESSCLSSEPDDYEEEEEEESMMMQYRPEVTSTMVLVACPRCLMYVMLSEVDPKCPQCKSTVFLDFVNEENTKWAKGTE